MNLWVAGAVTLAAVAGMMTLLFFLRRRSPVGGFFSDSDRAAGVFGMIGTSFAVLLAFVIFLAFESYQGAKAEAGREAIAVLELYTTAHAFSETEEAELRGELVCYARAVYDDEWRAMRDRHASDLVDRWTDTLERTFGAVQVSTDKQTVAYEHWYAEDDIREEARRGRLAEATPVVPAPLWFILLLGSGLVLTYMLAHADRGERFVLQALMVGAVTAVVASSLLVIYFLDRPYENRSGSIQPVEMERTLEHIAILQEAAGERLMIPCDENGVPTAS
jgi:hypothetical protein